VPPADHQTVPAVPVSEQSANKEQIWQQMLDNLEQNSVKALLRQHCHLFSFDGTVALIGITSKPLLKLAQDKLPNIKAAFQRVYQKDIKVMFKVVETTSAQPTATNREAVTPSPSKSPSPVEDEDDQDDRKTQGTVIPQPERKIVPPNETSSNPAEETQSVSLPDSSISAPIETGDWDEEKIKDAVTALEKFFNGHVINLEDELNLPTLETSSSTEAAKPTMHSLQSQSFNDTDSITIQNQQTPEITTDNSMSQLRRSDTFEYDENGDIAF
jgi:DNA polymerase-3 subunit gamma/tau